MHENARRRGEVTPNGLLIGNIRPGQGLGHAPMMSPHVLAVDPTVHLSRCPIG